MPFFFGRVTLVPQLKVVRSLHLSRRKNECEDLEKKPINIRRLSLGTDLTFSLSASRVKTSSKEMPMSKQLVAPPVADTNIQTMLAMRRALATVTTAQELKFFDRIGDNAFTIESVAKDFSMSLRAAEAMVAVLASVNWPPPKTMAAICSPMNRSTF